MCKHVLTALAVFVLAALLSPADAWAESPDAAPVQVLDSVCYEAICLTYDAQPPLRRRMSS